MTCSVGFRAPSISNMVSEYAENLATDIDQALRYEDPDLACQHYPAEISTGALARIKTIIARQLTVDDGSLMRWFGEFSSESRSGIHPLPPEKTMATYDKLATLLATESTIARSPAAKFLFTSKNETTLLFVDGTCHEASQALAKTLTEHRKIAVQQLMASVNGQADQRVLLELYNCGCLFIQ
jgi:50S ribosomal protein L16 3-hydroxylase